MTPPQFGPWRKPPLSSGTGNCVEQAFAQDGTNVVVGIRDSKAPRGGLLIVPQSAHRALLDAVAR